MAIEEPNPLQPLHDQIAAFREEVLTRLDEVRDDLRVEMHTLNDEMLGRFDALARDLRDFRREFYRHQHGDDGLPIAN
jgi:hypothetical protein